MKNRLTLLILMLTSALSFSFKNDLSTICVRPDSDELFIGGEFKTIFVIDKNSGTELRRISLESKAIDMQFSENGEHLLVFDGSKVMFLHPETGEEKMFVKAGSALLYEDSPYFIDCDWIFTKSVTVYSTEDGSVVLKHTPEFDPLNAGFDAEFKELIILGRSQEIKSEKKLIVKRVEQEDSYNIYNKAYVEQQDDKKGSGFEVVDIESKSSKLKVEIPYITSNSFGLSISKFKEHYFLSCWDMLLKVDNAGMVMPISCSDATFAYATNSIQEGKKIMVSSTKEGFVYDCETEQIIPFNAKSDNEFVYSKDITFDKNKTYMLNADYTVSVFNEKLVVTNRFKIDNSTGNGFGVYYYNGYSKKEDRDKEATIINKVGKAYEIDLIDLEQFIGSGDVLIATFETIEKAEEYSSKLDAEGLSYITKVAPIE
ncbi:MAG: hypothetical protein MI810_06920 [Flavobacteriales bacterium]|nr:hypothetical protein [Flavobacteriales bacterium]